MVLAPPPSIALTLALAVVESSTAPLLLLDGDYQIVAGSASFTLAFGLAPSEIVGTSVFELGGGEWNLPRLRSLLATALESPDALPAYEIDLKLPGRGTRRLVLNARRLTYDDRDDPEATRLLLAIADVTDARLSEKIKDDLLREKAVMMQEIQHRVANSLQIIASVLMQSARRVGSEESRGHLRDAHGRVLAMAELQRHLAESDSREVTVGNYLGQLCRSLGASMIDDHERILLTATADASQVTANVSVSLGLVVTELVINALKHAFPNERKGAIAVDYRRDAADWTLSVSDDGVGIATERTAQPGLGTSIVNALAKHLEAEVQVSNLDPGTRVALVHDASRTEGSPELDETAV